MAIRKSNFEKKQKHYHQKETSNLISKSTTNKYPLHTKSNIGNRKTYDLVDFIMKSDGGKETHNVQSLNKDEKYEYLVESKRFFDAETFIAKWYTKSKKTLKNLDLINIPGMCIVHVYEGVSHVVEYDPNKGIKFKQNQYILERIKK